jgi:hypothetical protein
MGAVVYFFCALLSSLCAVMLFVKFCAAKNRMVFWCAICFGGLALNNMLLFADNIVVPHDMSSFRAIPALLGLLALIWGGIGEGK